MGNFVASTSSSDVHPVSGVKSKTSTANIVILDMSKSMVLFPIQTFLLF